jgi:methylmalonyl-CoA mutase, C-terminal domain
MSVVGMVILENTASAGSFAAAEVPSRVSNPGRTGQPGRSAPLSASLRYRAAPIRLLRQNGEMASRLRVVIAKPGLDGHDRGAKLVARALRDAGMEVIYTGLHQTPEQIVQTVLQEDADAVGLSVLSGAHMTLFGRLMELMREQGLDDVVVFGGGIVPEEDIPELRAMGVATIFTPGASMADIVEWVRSNVGTWELRPHTAPGTSA